MGQIYLAAITSSHVPDRRKGVSAQRSTHTEQFPDSEGASLTAKRSIVPPSPPKGTGVCYLYP
jgi:hypothetical protein